METNDNWDRRLCEHGGHFLQSWSWGEFKQRHCWTPERIVVNGDDGIAMAQVLFRHRGPVSIGYVPRGPMIRGDCPKLWPRFRARLDEVARRHRAISVILEPDRPLNFDQRANDNGLVCGPDHIQPVRTVKVPLLDDDDLLGQMHKKTRYNIRLAARRGVTFGVLDASRENVAAVYELMRDTAQRNEFGIHAVDYYQDVLEYLGDDGVLLAAWSPEGELAAGLIAARFGNEAIYLYGASSTEHRSHGAGLALQFEAMKWARERGSTVYDLWGIPALDPETVTDEGADTIAGSRGNDWRGLYRFKTGFGGEIVSYPETLERRYLPGLPWLARRLRILHG